MKQTWDMLIFLHFRVDYGVLRGLVPEPLEIDMYDGDAWFSITPLTIYGLRPPYLPAVPYISRLHELNVRAYVHYKGVPGVWFFSLDANNLLAVLGARAAFALPYFYADITLTTQEGRVDFDAVRYHSGGRFSASWTVGEPLPLAKPGSIDFFLVERYCLYAADAGDIYRCRIHHVPWPLQGALDLTYDSNIAQVAGLPTPTDTPLLHCGGPITVDVWWPERIVARV